eukprot:1158105-Pelagomonas_calceolata.AAC.3
MEMFRGIQDVWPPQVASLSAADSALHVIFACVQIACVQQFVCMHLSIRANSPFTLPDSQACLLSKGAN